VNAEVRQSRPPEEAIPPQAEPSSVLEVLFRDTQVRLCLLDPAGRVVRASRGWLQATGLTAGSALGRDVWELFPDSPEHLRALHARARSGEVVEVEPFRQLQGGHDRWWEGRICPVPMAGGTGLLIESREVTDRVRSEALVHALYATVDGAHETSARLEQQHAITSALASALTPAEVARAVFELGLRLPQADAGTLCLRHGDALTVAYVHGVGGPGIAAGSHVPLGSPVPLAEAARTRKPIWLESPDETDARFPAIAEQSRSAGYVAAAVLPLLDGGGEVLGVLGLAYTRPHQFTVDERAFIQTMAVHCALALSRAADLARQRAAVKRLERLQSVTSALASALTPRDVAEAVFEKGLSAVGADLATISTLHGQETLELTYMRGPRETEAVGPPRIPLDGAYADAVAARTGEAVWCDGSAEIEARFPKTAYRISRPFEAIAHLPLRASDGSIRGVLSLGYAQPHHFNDDERTYITLLAEQLAQALERARLYESERTAREEAERVRRLQETLMSVVGHDLRTPITSIATGAHLVLTRGGLGEQQAATIGRIARAADRVRGIIRDLVDFGRARRGGALTVERKETRIDELCERVTAEIRQAHPACSVELASCGEVVSSVDPGRIAQVMSNLIGNAVQHGRGAPVRVTVDGAPDAVILQVWNGGPPIPPAERPHLFEAFKRSSSSGGDQGSLGLGLFIVHEVVKAHGGTVEVQSDAERGTAFTVRLPRATLDLAPPTP
jgi:PAS domain S-box-containing protein